jgi:hypothetical protein
MWLGPGADVAGSRADVAGMLSLQTAALLLACRAGLDRACDEGFRQYAVSLMLRTVASLRVPVRLPI